MFGAPLKLDDRVLGMIGGCMVRPSRDHLSPGACERICRKYDCSVSLDELRRALDEMPVYTEQELGSTLAIFSEMANALSEVAKRQYLLKVEQAKREALSRYFSPNIFSLIEAEGQSLEYRGEATVLFADMRDFTARSERLPPAGVVELLNEYFEEMVASVFQFDGTLDKFIGDALLAVFGAPIPAPDGPLRAVRAAFDMLQRLERLNARRAERGLDAIEMGIGIHTGAVVGGNIGSPQRLEYTVVGDTVNVASRLEALTKSRAERVVVSEATYRAVQAEVVVAGHEELQLRGKSTPTRIYRLAGLR
jgi:class 3 adenylate cyclase